MDEQRVMRLNLRQKLIIILLALALLGGQVVGYEVSLYQLAVAVVLTVLLDSTANQAFRKKFRISENAIITGLIIGLVLAPGVQMEAVVLASVAAVGATLIITQKNRNIFNPAGFGLVAAAVFFKAPLGWWGAAAMPSLVYAGVPIAIVLFGGYIAYRARKLHQALAYVLAYGALSMFFPLSVNWFFAFIMISDPMTSPAKRNGGVLFGAIVAVAAFAASFGLPMYSEIAALMLANALVPTINKYVK